MNYPKKSFSIFPKYEHKSQPLASKKTYKKRLYKNSLLAFAFLAICLITGIVGYAILGPMPWIDAVHNASMILSGMGPVLDKPLSTAGKIFSSFYALFSGVAFISTIGLLIAPVVHRFFHRLHVEDK